MLSLFSRTLPVLMALTVAVGGMPDTAAAVTVEAYRRQAQKAADGDEEAEAFRLGYLVGIMEAFVLEARNRAAGHPGLPFCPPGNGELDSRELDWAISTVQDETAQVAEVLLVFLATRYPCPLSQPGAGAPR